MSRALGAVGLAATDVRAVGLGMAGVSRPSDREAVRGILSRIGSFARVVLTHDAEAALVGGVGRRYGVVLIAGTGAIAYGVNSRSESWRADGWGYLAGDEGSAYWIGVEALHAVTRAHDGRGPNTALSQLLFTHLRLEQASQLVPRIYSGGFGVPQVAGLASQVAEAARGGDEVARTILAEAGWQLGRSVQAVVCGLDMAGDSFEAVLTGGVLRNQELVWQTVVGQLAETAPRARAIAPRHNAAYGAALLARQSEERG